MSDAMGRTPTWLPAVLCLAFGIVTCRAQQTIEIDGVTYVPVAEVATRFGLSPAKRKGDAKEGEFRSETGSLVVRIDSRQALIDGVRYWLSHPVRKNRMGRACLATIDVETVLARVYSPASVKLPRAKTIVFDPGHGGHDKGGRSNLGYEKDYVLDIVKRSRAILEKRGYKVVQSRLGDFFVPLSERPEMTANYEDPVFVSIHLNSAGWRPAASGLEIFAIPPRGAPPTGAKPDPIKDRADFPGYDHEAASFALAHTVHQTLLGKTDGFDRGVKRARFVVLRSAEVPAVLIEGAFLTNPEEAVKIHSPEWRESFASAIADGLEAYFALANEGKSAPTAQGLGRAPTDEFVDE